MSDIKYTLKDSSMKINWRPKDWINPKDSGDIGERFDEVYEEGADAMLEELRKGGVRDCTKEVSGTWVYIPDGDIKNERT